MDAMVADETRVDTICKALFDAIFAQELLPGTKLSEEAIGSLFGVSRTVIRAVFNRLHSDRLIELHRNRGAFVASPTVEEAREVFQARITIERDIAYSLAGTITSGELGELEAHFETEKQAYGTGERAVSIRLSGNSI